MHLLSTQKNHIERVAHRYMEGEVTDFLTSPYINPEGWPLIMDGYGYNRWNIEEALQEHPYEVTALLFLGWFDENKQAHPEFVPLFEELCDVYIESGKIEYERFDQFAPIFERSSDYPYFDEVRTRFSGGSLLCLYLTAIVFESTDDILEPAAHLFYRGMEHVMDTMRISFIETDFASFDPDEDRPPEMSFQPFQELMASQEKAVQTWKKHEIEDYLDACQGVYLRNPIRGGGYSCML